MTAPEPVGTFGNDPGNETFTCYLNGKPIDPGTLPGYVATGPAVSIADAAKTGDWTIRDDGLIGYVRPATAQIPGQPVATTSAPPGLICVVNGLVASCIGEPPAGVVTGQPLPASYLAPAAPLEPVPTDHLGSVPPAAAAHPLDTAPVGTVAVKTTIGTQTITRGGGASAPVTSDVIHAAKVPAGTTFIKTSEGIAVSLWKDGLKIGNTIENDVAAAVHWCEAEWEKLHAHKPTQ